MTQLNEQEYELLHQNIEKLGLSIVKEVDEWLCDLAQQMGYQLVFDDSNAPLCTQEGPIVMMKNREYNNGLYIFRKDETTYYLQVVKPNTIDKSSLVTKVIHQIEDGIRRVSMEDLDAFDLTQIYAHVLVNQVVKTMAKQAFPESAKQQQNYINVYLPRFLANIARYYLADDALKEEAVNSEPYIVKVMIEQSQEGESHE